MYSWKQNTDKPTETVYFVKSHISNPLQNIISFLKLEQYFVITQGTSKNSLHLYTCGDIQQAVNYL
jgi:hypothetical protein